MLPAPVDFRESRSKFTEVLIALGLSIGAAVSLGFSRFAYALLLPPMRESMRWTYVEAGGMNTANAIGYVFGSLLAAWFSRVLGIKYTFLFSFTVSALALLASGLVNTYPELAALRFVGGLATAVLFIIGASLATGISPQSPQPWTALLVSVYITGVGSGIVISGLVLPPILERIGVEGWQNGWILLGAISLVLLLAAALAVRALPPQQRRDASALPLSEAIFLWPTFTSYAFFGAGYVAYMTFIIVLLRQNGATAGATATFWIVLGVASVVGTMVWGRILGKITSGWGPSLVSIVVLVGTLPVLLSPGLIATYVSAILFGGSFMAGPSSATMIVRRLTAPHLATAAIAGMTVAFAIGQAIGPVVSGYVSDGTGFVSAGLWAASLMLIAAAFLAPLQQNRNTGK